MKAKQKQFRVRACAVTKGKVVNQYHECDTLADAKGLVKNAIRAGKAGVLDIDQRHDGKLWHLNWTMLERWTKHAKKWKRIYVKGSK